MSKERENDVSDKKHLHPNEVWIHWGATGKALALVATEEPVLGVTCTRFVRAAKGDEPDIGDELRECPFCGSSGRLRTGDDAAFWWVECSDTNNCGANITVRNRRRTAIDDWNRRAARGAEPEQFAAQVQPALSDEETLAVIAPVQIREDFSVDYDDEPEQPALSDEEIMAAKVDWESLGLGGLSKTDRSDEERQVVELVRLMREVRDKEDVDVDLFFAREGSECISVDGYRVHYTILDKPIDWLRSRLAPPPQRPTQEEYAEFIEKLLQPSFGGRLPNWHRRIAESFSERKRAADKHDAAGGEHE